MMLKVHSVICRFGIHTDKPGFRNTFELCGGALWDVGSYAVSATLSLFPNKGKGSFSEVLKNKYASRYRG